MTTPPEPQSQPPSADGRRLFSERGRLILANYLILDDHLMARRRDEFRDAQEELRLMNELLRQASQEPQLLSRARLITICERYQLALDSLIGTFDFKMRVEMIGTVMLILVASSSGLVAGRYGPGPAVAMAAISLIVATYLGLEAKQKLDSTFRYAYSLQAQMKRDLGLAIKVIEDDMSPHH